MVGQKFRHAITMGQGNLGQSWRNSRTRGEFFQTKHLQFYNFTCTIDCALKHKTTFVKAFLKSVA